ncbi:MAG TPA: ABC transporter permease [Acidiferrobacteraceae bacterium]|nr:ABC transporter permease [Acidiferrobacteraceae bacterium]
MKDIKPAAQRPEIHIRPARGIGFGDFAEIFRNRRLLLGMARRRLDSRFNNLYLGFFWATARPLLMTLVFVFIKKLSEAKMGGGIPYPAYLFSGLVLWFYLAGSITQTAAALERDAGLVQKIYFPRLISPMSPMLANLVDLMIGIIILIPIMIYFKLWPGWEIILLPLVLAQIMAMILGVGLVFAALNLISRDWSQLLGLMLYIGLFMSPVIYSVERLPATVQRVYFFNPAAGTLMAMRASLFEPLDFPWGLWSYSVGFSLGVLLLGLAMFRRVEHKLLDEL